MPKTSRTARYRRDVSRVEGFSDAVFAFAVTLLVVSLEVPKTFLELMATMREFPAFAVCFALLFQLWWRHYQFFRSYDLEDGTVIVLTGVLLFVVLFYVYPLKFLWSVVFAPIARRAVTDDVITASQMPALFIIYGAGVSAAFGILALLYAHAYRLRESLELTIVDILNARVQIYRNVGIASFGCLSILVAVVTSLLAPRLVGIAGYVYFGIGINEWVIGEYHGRQRKRLRATHA